MNAGFLLFIDEAGEEGLNKVRPDDPDGSSEYFVMAGVLIRPSRYHELRTFMNDVRQELKICIDKPIHFRDLDDNQLEILIKKIKNFKFSVVAVVSNKRNMKGYRNRNIEKIEYEIKRNRILPKNNSWFYNHTFRYLLESASAECAFWSNKIYNENMPIRIIFAERKSMSYSQTRAYLYKLKMQPRDKSYFNSKHRVDWRVVNYNMIESLKPKNEIGLQLADCVASMIYKSIDEDNFKNLQPSFIEAIAPKFMRSTGAVKGFGFKLLPHPFTQKLSSTQKRSLRSVGYYL